MAGALLYTAGSAPPRRWSWSWSWRPGCLAGDSQGRRELCRRVPSWRSAELEIKGGGGQRMGPLGGSRAGPGRGLGAVTRSRPPPQLHPPQP